MKKLFTTILCLSILLINGYAPAVAKEDNVNSGHELFLRYLTNSDAYSAHLQEKIDRLFKLTFQDCKILDSVKRLTPQVITPPTFRDSNLQNRIDLEHVTFSDIHPTNGQWVEKSLVEGCGNITQLNFIATAYDLKELPELLPAINGQTKIDLIDQEKAENMVSQTINNELGCFDSIFVLGTRLMGYKNATDDKLSTEDENAGWYERWIVEACKQYRTINIAILPDPKTRYNYVIQIAKEEE